MAPSPSPRVAASARARSSARTRQPAAAAIAAVLVAAGLIAACSGGDDGDAAAGDDTSSGTSAPAPSGELPLRVGEITVESLGEPAELDGGVRDAVLEAVQAYVDEASLRPLLEGEAAGIDDLFGEGVRARVARGGPDRGALTDDAVPRATHSLRTRAEPVALAALADGFGGYVWVAATVDYTIETLVEGGPLTIHRFGDLYLSKGGPGWIVTAYDIAVTRETRDGRQTDGAGGGSGTGSGGSGSTAGAGEGSGGDGTDRGVPSTGDDQEGDG